MSIRVTPVPAAPARVAAELRAAEIARDAQLARCRAGDPEATDAALARRWGVTHAYVARLFDPASGKAITLRDVLACGRGLARELLTRALASLDAAEAAPADPRDTLARIAVQIGEAHKGVLADLAADGAIDRHDVHEASFSRVAALALRGVAAAQRAGAAAKGGAR